MDIAVDHVGIAPPHTEVVSSSDGFSSLSFLGNGSISISTAELKGTIRGDLVDLGMFQAASTAFLDSSSGIGYVALQKNDKNYHVAAFYLNVEESRMNSVTPIDCGFGAMTTDCRVVGVRTQHGAIVLAVSGLGSVTLLAYRGSSKQIPDVAVTPNIAKLDTRVLAIDTSVSGHCAILSSLEGKHLRIHVLVLSGILTFPACVAHVNSTQSSILPGRTLDDGQSVDMFEPIWISKAPRKSSKVIGFAMLPDAAFVLFSCGTLRIFKPPELEKKPQDSLSLQNWKHCQSMNPLVPQPHEGSTADARCDNPRKKRKSTTRLSPKFEVTLLPYPVGMHDTSADNGSSETSVHRLQENELESRGGVVILSNDFVAVGYGRVLSVWDGTYGVGHGFVELASDIITLSRDCRTRRAVAYLLNNAVVSVGFDQNVSVSLNLGCALKHQHSCLTVIDSQSASSLPNRAPLRAQPVALGVLQAAADAGGCASDMFENFLRAEDKEERYRVRKILNPMATRTADDVSKYILKYVAGNKAVRRYYEKILDVDPLKDQGPQPLRWLPSERMAATVVARCLRELHHNRFPFLIPLVDILSSGVVSADFVLAVMSDLNDASLDKDGEGHVPVSISSPLLRTIETTSALEAMLMRVSDLSEIDVVRMLQFALRVRNATRHVRRTVDEIGTLIDKESIDGNRVARDRAERVLVRCLTRAVDERQISSALFRMPLADVLIFLHYLRLVLEDMDFAKVSCFPNRNAPGFGLNTLGDTDIDSACCYRGLGAWLDEPVFGKAAVVEATSRLQRLCLDWISRIVDTHMSTLIMDEAGPDAISDILKVVRFHTKMREGATHVEGALKHVLARHPVPSDQDPLYCIDVIEVSGFSALT